MIDPNLPADLVAFLESGKPAEYDPARCAAGTVKFHSVDQLQVQFFPMASNAKGDPHARKGGSYLVAGVSLIASCEHYRLAGLLLWLPLDSRYGTWDGEHQTLRVFAENIDWSTIVKDLPRYINSQWKMKGSARLYSLASWVHHAYNAEQLFHPLPDIPEWYEAKWVHRGEYQDGVQLRYPEEVQVRIARGNEQCEATVRTQKPEQGAELSPAVTVALAADALERLSVEIDRGFWNPIAEHSSGGEIETYWTITGFKSGVYRKLYRSFGAGGHRGDAVHELGVALSRAAGLDRFSTEF